MSSEIKGNNSQSANITIDNKSTHSTNLTYASLSIILPDNIITPEQLLSANFCQKQDYVYANFREQQTDLIKLDSETENS